jgi:Ca2+-binding EF-hand superfamily protein
MGSNRSILLQKDEIQEISAETGFSPKQITRLYCRFTSLDKKNLSYLTKEDFVRIPELHINPLRDRIIDVIVDDNGSNDRINFKQFAKLFSTFRRGKTDNVSKDNKLKFLFSVYDRDKDNKINKTG